MTSTACGSCTVKDFGPGWEGLEGENVPQPNVKLWSIASVAEQGAMLGPTTFVTLAPA